MKRSRYEYDAGSSSLLVAQKERCLLGGKTDQKEKPELDKVKNDIIEEIANDKVANDATLQITALVELRKEYKMEIQDSELKKQYDLYIENSLEQAKESNAQDK